MLKVSFSRAIVIADNGVLWVGDEVFEPIKRRFD